MIVRQSGISIARGAPAPGGFGVTILIRKEF